MKEISEGGVVELVVATLLLSSAWVWMWLLQRLFTRCFSPAKSEAF